MVNESKREICFDFEMMELKTRTVSVYSLFRNQFDLNYNEDFQLF